MEAKTVSRVTPPPRTTRTAAQAQADPDHFLVLQVQAGHLPAFNALVEKYKQPLVSFATRILGDAMEAQDVAQNAFVRVFKESSRFRFKCKFSTWLHAIARNLCRNELRRRSRHQVELLGRDEGERPASPQRRLDGPKPDNVPEVVFQRELQEKIEQALESLPERQRAAILLLRNEDYSYADIAAMLGTSQSAIKTLIHRGRQALKRDLQPYLSTGVWRVSWAGAFTQ
jgi:RNA polymerase sigma-70 factor, ECF subfamily